MAQRLRTLGQSPSTPWQLISPVPGDQVVVPPPSRIPLWAPKFTCSTQTNMKVKDEYTQNNFFKEVLKSLVTAEAPNSQHTGNMTVTCQPLKKTDSIPPQLQEKCMEAEKNVKSLKNGMQCAVLISQQVTSVALFNLQQLQHLHRSSTNPVPPVTPILAYCRLSLVRRTKPCKQN